MVAQIPIGRTLVVAIAAASIGGAVGASLALLATRPAGGPADASATGSALSSDGPVASATPGSAPPSRAVPTAEQAQRLAKLESDLATLQISVELLRTADRGSERPAPTPSGAPTDARTRDQTPARAAGIDPSPEERLSAVGLPQSDVDRIVGYANRRELARLEVRNEGRRAEWSRAEIAAAQREVDQRLLEEVGADDYDRLLYASGESNRVYVVDTIGGSAAASLDLRPQDVIYAYAGERVFDFGQLIRLTESGQAGATVELEIRRGDRVIREQIPRGPIGARIAGVALDPTGAESIAAAIARDADAARPPAQ